jgi:cytochrome c
MSISKRVALFAACFAIAAGSALAEPIPQLGQPATPDQISAYDIDVSPDGTGLPPGSATAAQGGPVYQAKCAACHGAQGQGGAGGALAGGIGTIGVPGKKPFKTVGSFWPYATSVFAYVRRAMPYDHPKTLSNDELYGVTAFVLYLNGLVRQDDVMNAQSLPKVQMPNRNGFRPFKDGD